MNPSPADRPPPPKRAPGVHPFSAKPPASRPAPAKTAPAKAVPAEAGPAQPVAEAPQFVTDAPTSRSDKKKSSPNKTKAKKGPKSPWPMIAGSAGGAILGALVLVIAINAMKKPPEKPRPRVTKQINRQELPRREIKPADK